MLNEQNETKSIQNITNTCKEILDRSCDFEIVRGEPKQKNNDNNLWAVPITINVKFNKNIEQFNQYLFNSIKGLSMSQDEVEKYKQLGKQAYKLAFGEGGDGGITDNIELLKKLSNSNPNLNFKILSGSVNGDFYFPNAMLFESNNLKSILTELNKTIKKENAEIGRASCRERV